MVFEGNRPHTQILVRNSVLMRNSRGDFWDFPLIKSLIETIAVSIIVSVIDTIKNIVISILLGIALFW